ncbi:hypothetical protein SARC_17318, partial [Sphaeroforma arctica JP610]
PIPGKPLPSPNQLKYKILIKAKKSTPTTGIGASGLSSSSINSQVSSFTVKSHSNLNSPGN